METMQEAVEPGVEVVQYLYEELSRIVSRVQQMRDRFAGMILDGVYVYEDDAWRDMQHLFARLEGTARQLEDMQKTAERLRARVVEQPS